jgi:hypothetical protein
MMLNNDKHVINVIITIIFVLSYIGKMYIFTE